MNLERVFAGFGAACLGAGVCLVTVLATQSAADDLDNAGAIDRVVHTDCQRRRFRKTPG